MHSIELSIPAIDLSKHYVATFSFSNWMHTHAIVLKHVCACVCLYNYVYQQKHQRIAILVGIIFFYSSVKQDTLSI